MTESPSKWSFEELQIKLHKRLTIRYSKKNETKQNTAALMDSGNAYNKSPLLNNYFLLKFFLMSSALLHLFKSNQNRTLKARSHDPFLRIQFLVPKTESRRSDGPISRFRFCGENVGRSFVVCSHDPFFRTNKESSIWRQNDHAEFVGTFHLSRRVSDENRAYSISIRFFIITDTFDGRSFLRCSHDPFFETNKNLNLKNGSCEQALE